ncbi:Uncharacterized protein M6B38_216895 [Iris pallida]|uniref:Uncharacterized protein n=1 Tax=Iris pallida TaxID=29817 RepID=A0AAX6E081_IRIPA|nr:Uncharacterized protein M6B38_216895 [Iris pallida]
MHICSSPVLISKFRNLKLIWLNSKFHFLSQFLDFRLLLTHRTQDLGLSNF